MQESCDLLSASSIYYCFLYPSCILTVLKFVFAKVINCLNALSGEGEGVDSAWEKCPQKNGTATTCVELK